MSPQRVLVIEDDSEIRELLSLHLNRNGYEVTSVDSGEAALVKFKETTFDLALVDWMLPGMTGLEVIRSIRLKYRSDRLGILMLTAKGSPSDVISGLDAGADDYCTKPFDLGVVTARARALMRRVESAREEALALAEAPSGVPMSPVLQAGNLVVNTDSHEVMCGGKKVLLTPSEYKLLQALLANRGKVLTRQRLIECVQGEGIAVVDRAIDTHVFGLRKKISPCSDVIETVRGVGYRVL